MPLQLKDMRFDDGPAYAHTYISSFYNDHFSRASFADITFDQRIAGVIRRWPKNYSEKSVVYKKVVDTDTGELVGWAKIAFENTDIDAGLVAPTDIPEDIIHTQLPPTAPKPPNDTASSSQNNASSGSDFSSRARAARLRDLGDRPAIILYLIGTHPKAQRRGVASLLMRWVTGLADQRGLACWVTSSPVAVPLYRKFGFQVMEEIVVKLPEGSEGGSSYTHTCMLREPKER